MSFAAGTGSLISYGLAFWLPSFLARSFHPELVDRSLIFGSIQLVGGVPGVWLGGLVGDGDYVAVCVCGALNGARSAATRSRVAVNYLNTLEICGSPLCANPQVPSV